MLIDTGSSFTWLGANQSYVPSDHGKLLPEKFSLKYGGAPQQQGDTYNETLTLSGGPTITQRIGVVQPQNGFDFDGILGIGPSDLNDHVLVGTTESPPTIVDSLFDQHQIERTFGISFAPLTVDPATQNVTSPPGEISWGSCDSTKYTGNLTMVDVTRNLGPSFYWGVDLKVTYGDSKFPILNSGSGIVDTGSAFTLFENQTLQTYITKVGAEWDNTHELPMLRIPKTNYGNLHSLFFTVRDRTLEFTANAQILPAILSSSLDKTGTYHYLSVGPIPVKVLGTSFILGYPWLERFYSCFDAKNNQIGFAETQHTFDQTN